MSGRWMIIYAIRFPVLVDGILRWLIAITRRCLPGYRIIQRLVESPGASRSLFSRHHVAHIANQIKRGSGHSGAFARKRGHHYFVK